MYSDCKIVSERKHCDELILAYVGGHLSANMCTDEMLVFMVISVCVCLCS
jgi:hypothetical protein